MSQNVFHSRPYGVTLVAIFCALKGVFELGLAVLSLLALIAGTVFTPYAQGAFQGIIYLVSALFYFVLAWGLWGFKRWAYVWTIIITGLGLLLDALLFVQSRVPVAIRIGSMIVGAIVLIILLLEPGTRSAFRRRTSLE